MNLSFDRVEGEWGIQGTIGVNVNADAHLMNANTIVGSWGNTQPRRDCRCRACVLKGEARKGSCEGRFAV